MYCVSWVYVNLLTKFDTDVYTLIYIYELFMRHPHFSIFVPCTLNRDVFQFPDCQEDQFKQNEDVQSGAILISTGQEPLNLLPFLARLMTR